jgi:hypothetical protein
MKAGQPARPNTKDFYRTKVKRKKIMPQHLVANYLPDDFDPSTIPKQNG